MSTRLEFLQRRERDKLKSSRLRAEYARLYRTLKSNKKFRRLTEIQTELQL